MTVQDDEDEERLRAVALQNAQSILLARRRAEEELRKQSEWLRITLASIGDAVISTDGEGRVTFMNGVAEALTGWRQAEGLGHPLPDVFHIVNEQTRRPVENPVDKVLRDGRIVGLANHTVLIARGGAERPIDDSAAPILDERGELRGVVLVFRDITEKKQAEAEVRRSAEQARTILESIAEAFFALDGDWRFTYVNPQAERVLDRKPGELLGKVLWDEFPGLAGSEFEPVYRRAAAERITLSLTSFYPDHDCWYEVHVYPAPDGLSVYFRDVTEHHRLLEELEGERRRLRAVVENVPAGIVLAESPSGKIVLQNRQVGEILRHPGMLSENIGAYKAWVAHHPDGRLVEPDEWPLARTLRGEVRRGDDFLYQRGDGTRAWIRVGGAPIRDEGGGIVGGVVAFYDIDPEKRAEEALRQAEQQWRHLAEALPNLVWTDTPDGQCDYLSGQWGTYTGIPESELLGLVWLERVIHPDDRERTLACWLAAVEDKGTYDLEYRIRRHDGQYRWFKTRGVPIRDDRGRIVKWFGTCTDIEDQKRAGDAARFLAAASAALATLVDYESTLQKVANLAVPYFADWAAVDVVGEGGAIRRLAVAHQDPAKVQLAQELVRSYPPAADAPGGIGFVLRTGQPEIVADVTDDMLVRGAKDEGHLRLIRALGLRSYLSVPLIVKGQSMGVLTFATAESGRNYTQADLALAEDLSRRAAIAIENAQLYRALKDGDRKKDEFLAVLAHELRNPLAPLSNALQVMRLTAVNSQAAPVREMMERQVRHMTRLVDDLLDVSRITSGKIVLQKERLDLAEVVSSALETSRPLIEAARHELTVTPPRRPLRVEGDKTRLAQVVSNLLTNSAKYTPEGGRIWLTVEQQGREALLGVRDNGMGIPGPMLARIFEMFTQVDRNLGRSQGGLGIGLTLVRSLVEMHGGSVEARSGGPGRGSEFVIRLPLLPDEPEGHPDKEKPRAADSSTRRRILVVDDNVDSAKSLAMMLSLSGNEVRTVHDGPSALEAAALFSPDVVLLDIGLPGIDGYEVARRLRLMPALKGALLVAQTGWGQAEDRRRSDQAGFDHHFTKPIDPAALRALLASLDSAEG